MTDDCKACNAIYDVREGGEPTGYCDPCAQDRVDELESREPLVQEVIAAVQAITGDEGTWKTQEAWYQQLLKLKDAARKLAEWKP